MRLFSFHLRFATCRQFLVILSVLASGSMLACVSGCAPESKTVAADANPSTGNAVERVPVGSPQRKTLKLQTVQPGHIESFEEASLRSRLSAFVGEVRVDIGDRVSEGQVLVQLLIPELSEEVKQKEAQVTHAKALRAQAQAGIGAALAALESAKSKVAEAQAGIGRVDSEYQRWRAEAERIRELAQRGSVTVKLVDETDNQLRASEAAKGEAQAAVQSAQSGLREAEAATQISEASVAVADAKLEVALADLAYTRALAAFAEIKAPFSGVITQRHVHTGHYVVTGDEPLLVLSRTDRMRLVVDVPEMEAPMVDAGESADTATVRIQSLGGAEWNAQVSRTGWSLASGNRSLRTELDLPNPEGRIRPGMYATVSLLLEQRENALTLPAAAIIRDGQNSYCCLFQDGKARRHPIQVGLRVGDDVEVVSGLEESQVVVLARAASLKPDQAIEALPAKK